MSDQQNNSTPPSGQNRGPGDSPGFNWRLLGLLSVAVVILGIAFFVQPTGNAESLSYSQFRKAWDQGRIVTGETEKPLQIVTSDSSADVTISGWIEPEKVPAPDAVKETDSFQVILDSNFLKEVQQIVGERIEITDDAAFQPAADARKISFAEFRRAYALGNISGETGSDSPPHIINTGTSTVLVGKISSFSKYVVKKDAQSGKDQVARPFSVPVSGTILKDQLATLLSSQAKYKKDPAYLRSAISMFLPFILVIALLFFLFRQQMKSAGRGAMSFGKSKARLLTMDRNKVTFKDVAGIQEAKEELFEIVDFLRDPRKFQKLGGSIPKGVLMVGSPGTGKTLLARAIAGEADVPFFSISGSDFVEMFVGVGASRVRDMFEQGKKHAPCLIFIDEIDAVGRHRGHGMGGGHDEREQTLNQLLVEMDGFDTQEGVIIIAATNRPDVLDPALLRPGRFDRQVTVSLPDVNGREEILRVHVKKIKLAANTDLAVVARGTPGFSGAELANLVNEAALLAARKGLTAVTLAEMEEARDKVRWGRERRSLAMSDKERVGTAWHEAGHAYINMVIPHTHPLHKVTIIPRGPYLGATMYLPDGDKYSTQKKEALANLVVTMGGRIAEAFHSDDVSNGASGDIRQATSLARAMVCEWGMSDKLGMVEYGSGEGPVFLGRGDMGGGKVNYSPETAKVIDEEIKKFIDNAYAEAERILTENREVVEKIAMALLEYETLDASHLRDIIDFGEMRNPPSAPKPPPVPDELRKKPAPKATGDDRPDDGTPIPGAVGAPA